MSRDQSAQINQTVLGGCKRAIIRDLGFKSPLRHQVSPGHRPYLASRNPCKDLLTVHERALHVGALVRHLDWPCQLSPYSHPLYKVRTCVKPAAG